MRTDCHTAVKLFPSIERRLDYCQILFSSSSLSFFSLFFSPSLLPRNPLLYFFFFPFRLSFSGLRVFLSLLLPILRLLPPRHSPLCVAPPDHPESPLSSRERKKR